MDRVLVTGGAGFIGAHVCKALAKSGYGPIVYDNLSRGHRAASKFGPFEAGDIRDIDRLSEVLLRHKPISVIHMAALAYVRESVEDPLTYYENNVTGSICLIRAACKAEIPTLVFSSTCATYGAAGDTPITELHPTNPINPYGRSKLMVEQILRDSERSNLKSVSLRYFNACGSDPDGEIGEWHQPETHVVPLCLMAAGGEIGSFQLLGQDHPTPDGTPIRDFIHVSDLANAHVLAMRYLIRGGQTRVFNLGIGRGYSVREVIAAAERVSGRSVPIKVLPRHVADPPTLLADASLARNLLGFAPVFTDIEQMIGHAWAWRKKAAVAYQL